MKKSFYITTAISYLNGAPHIGHAYELMATDALARFKRLDGYDVTFLTGTDEHGQKVQQTALKNGKTAQEMVDELVVLFQDMANYTNASNDVFIRTTSEKHKQASQEIWRRIEANGDIYLDSYAGWYSVRDEAFYAEKELNISDSGDKFAPITGTPVEWVEEKSYFFKLSNYQDKLLKHYEKNPDFIGPDTRRNEVISFVKGGLEDLSISRTSFDWGIKVPDADNHIMYVWVDALTNYLTGVGFPDDNSEQFKKFWPADLHIIGKDILRFHAIYWPAFLMAADLELPKRVYGHGFLFNRGEKMSKSVGNVINPQDMIKQYGIDQTRYFFLREVPFGSDGNYSHEAIVNRVNADLANDYGNLSQRCLSMVAKNCAGKVPEYSDFTADDKAILNSIHTIVHEIREYMDKQAIHSAIGSIFNVVAEANRYFATHEPWSLKKTDPQRMQTVLYVTMEVIRNIAILTQPYMPTASNAILDLLNIDENCRDFSFVGTDNMLKPGLELPKPEPVFPRYIENEK